LKNCFYDTKYSCNLIFHNAIPFYLLTTFRLKIR
jgi:hypothetical protein